MATHLQQKRRQAEQALDRITRMRTAIAEADRALAEYEAALAMALGKSIEGMEDVHAIVAHVCQVYAITPGALISRVRTEGLVEARHMAIAVAHVLTPHAKHKLGRFFQRDHGTIDHALAAHGRRLDTDRSYHHRFDAFIDALSTTPAERKSA